MHPYMYIVYPALLFLISFFLFFYVIFISFAFIKVKNKDRKKMTINKHAKIVIYHTKIPYLLRFYCNKFSFYSSYAFFYAKPTKMKKKKSLLCTYVHILSLYAYTVSYKHIM